MEDKKMTCFIIMPISDCEGYESGHFKRVYEYVIKPACEKAGFKPVRADDVKSTNVIVIDIIKKIIESDMAICDLSSRNPNVFYELGIRQSFDLPVTLIKDDVTSRAFDIQGFRDIEYASTLRIDEVNKAVQTISESLIQTFADKGKDVNSIIELLGVAKAKVKETVEISQDTQLILQSIKDIAARIDRVDMKMDMEGITSLSFRQFAAPVVINQEVVESFKDRQEDKCSVGDYIRHDKFGRGIIKEIRKVGTEVKANILFEGIGEKILLVAFAKAKLLKENINDSL